MTSFRHKDKLYNKREKLPHTNWLQFTAPGHNYFGPGNPKKNGPPLTLYDYFAQIHDQDDDYEYTAWQESDDILLDQLNANEPTDAYEVMGRDYFRAKKIAADLGLIRTLPKKTKLSDEWKKRKADFIEMASHKKHKQHGDHKEYKKRKSIMDIAHPTSNKKQATFEKAPKDTSGSMHNDHHRRPTPIVPDTPEPTPPAPAAAAAQESASHLVTNPTPVDPFRDAQMKPYKDTVNVVMPFVTHGKWDYTTDVNWIGGFTIRLNSINDVMTSRTFSANPPNASTPQIDTLPTSGGVTIERPALFEHYSKLYKYHHVVGCKYKVTFIDIGQADQQWSIWTYHHGIQSPPLFNTGTSVVVPDSMREMHPSCHKTTLNNRTTANAMLAFERSRTSIKGYFTPGPDHVKNQVSEDNDQKVWLKSDEVSPLREQATFIINRSDWSRSINVTTANTLRFKLEIIYLVQWKDLNVIHEYPTNSETDYAITSYTTPASISAPPPFLNTGQPMIEKMDEEGLPIDIPL